MRSQSMLLRVSLPLVAWCAVAAAQSGPVSAPSQLSDAQSGFDQQFANVDKNRDGSIDPEEAATDLPLMKHFVQLDANKDGKLSKHEIQTGKQELHARRLSRVDEKLKAADTDGDGALSKAEAEAAGLGRVVNHFDRLDTNKDSKLTPDELRLLIRSRLSI